MSQTKNRIKSQNPNKDIGEYEQDAERYDELMLIASMKKTPAGVQYRKELVKMATESLERIIEQSNVEFDQLKMIQAIESFKTKLTILKEWDNVERDADSLYEYLKELLESK